MAREILSQLQNKKVLVFAVILNREIKLEGTLVSSDYPFLEMNVGGVIRMVNVFAVKEIIIRDFRATARKHLA